MRPVWWLTLLTIFKILLCNMDMVLNRRLKIIKNQKFVLEPLFAFQSKVIRVLNLWQKNSVFQSEVIQPLFDLADPNHPIHKEQQPNVSNTSNGSLSGMLNMSAVSKTPPSVVNRTSSVNKTPLNAGKPDTTNTAMWLNMNPTQMEVTGTTLLQLSGQVGINLLPGKSQVMLSEGFEEVSDDL